MKVIGQLERAQFENTTVGTLPGAASTGRVIADITTLGAAVPRFYNGTSWLPMLTGQATSLVSQNSGTSVTVNWATGLNQQIVLTGHALISFQNPQPGQVHTLVVSQAALEANGMVTPYQYKLNMTDQASRRKAYQPLGVLQSSEGAVYSWFYGAGVKPAYTLVPFAAGAPLTLPATAPLSIAVHPTLGTIGFSQTGTPFTGYLQYFDGGSRFQWGNKNLTTPTAAAAAVLAMEYSPDGQAVFIATGTTPFIQGWTIDGWGINSISGVYANPLTLPAGAGQCIAMHPSGTHVLIGHATTPFMSCYPISVAGQGSGAYGVKLANPSTVPASAVIGAAFSPMGDFLAVNTATTPFLNVWAFDVANGFGAISTNPGILPTSGGTVNLGHQIAWRAQGDYIAMAMSASPFLAVFPFNRSTGVIGANVCTLTGTSIPAATLTSLAWTPDGQYLIGGCGTTPFLYVWNFGGNNNTIINATAALFVNAGPGIAVNDVVVHPSGEYMTLGLTTTPFIMTYPLPRVARNYLKLLD